MDDDEIMRQINERGGGGGYNDIDDEMAALEAELASESKGKKTEDDELLALEKEDDEEEEKKKSKKIEKHESDDDLKALENEGFDDLDDEEESKPKQQAQPQTKSQPQIKSQTKPQPPPKKEPQKPVINKEELAKAMQAKQAKSNQYTEIDVYPEKVEKKYHSVEKMTSLGVLEKEKEICDKIIEYKKKIGEDYDTWEIKKESADDKIGIVTSTIQDGLWDFEMYKKKIQEQYAWESKLLLFSDKDPTLKDEQKNILKERVNNRKKIIEEELTRNPEEEADQGEEETPPQKEEPKKPIETPPPKPVPTPKTPQTTKIDYYPEKTEAKYHDVRKMDSLGVLEKEKKICDIIIAYKKKIGEEYDSWEIKKDTIDTRNDTITAAIENGIMDFEGYKKKIQAEYQWESKLLIFVDKDPSLNETQKKVLRERINNRKKIIEEELTKNPDEEAEEGEGQQEIPEKKVEEPKKNKEQLLITKSLSPLYDVPKEKEKEEIARLTRVVTDRLNEYRAAIEYFKTNQLSEQQTIAIKCAKEICIELKKIQDGKWREVNEFKLPNPITPEFIYGCSKEERDKRFIKVINGYKEQKKGVQDDLNIRTEGLKKLSKIQLKKVLATAKKDLDALKEKKEKYQKLINALEQYYQDKWVPAPLFVETEEEKRIQKINKEIPENTVRIQIGKTTYVKKDKLYLKVRIEDKNMEKIIYQKGPGDWSDPFEFQFDKSTFKSFYMNKINVYIYEKKHIIKDKYKGKFEMQARALKDHIECSGSFKIDLESKRDGQEVYAAFQVRTPCKEPEYIVESKPIMQVKLIYKPFDLKGKNNSESGIQYEVQQQKLTESDLKVNNSIQAAPIKTPTKMPTPSQKAQKTPGVKPRPGGAPGKKAGPPKEAIDKSEFKSEELQDPDCLDCLNTLQVLEFKINKYEEIRNKIDGRTPRELMQRIVKMKCKMNTLTNSLGDDISPNDYLALLKNTFDHDKKLATYFSQQKDAEKAKLVSERLPLLIKETEELIKQMPK